MVFHSIDEFWAFDFANLYNYFLFWTTLELGIFVIIPFYYTLLSIYWISMRLSYKWEVKLATKPDLIHNFLFKYENSNMTVVFHSFDVQFDKRLRLEFSLGEKKNKKVLDIRLFNFEFWEMSNRHWSLLTLLNYCTNMKILLCIFQSKYLGYNYCYI